MSKYDKLRAEFIAGGVTLRELATREGVSYDGLRQAATRGKWTAKRAEGAEALQREMADKRASFAYMQYETCREVTRVFLDTWRRHKMKMTPKDCAYMARALRDVVAVQRTALGLPVENRDRGEGLRVDIGALLVALQQQQQVVDATPKLRAIA